VRFGAIPWCSPGFPSGRITIRRCPLDHTAGDMLDLGAARIDLSGHRLLTVGSGVTYPNVSFDLTPDAIGLARLLTVGQHADVGGRESAYSNELHGGRSPHRTRVVRRGGPLREGSVYRGRLPTRLLGESG
jgi:hypothetical protein